MNDQNLQAVLKALATAEPPTAMNQHIISRLEANSAVNDKAVPFGRWRLLRLVPLACLLVGCVVGLALLSVRRPVQPRSPIGQSDTSGLASARLDADRPEQASHLSSPVTEVGAAQSRLSIEPHVGRASASGPRFLAAVSSRGKVSSRGAADLPSMLAPPLPLTAQEKLLVRAATSPQQDQLSMLNPEVRERELAQSHAEYNAFFPKPLPEEIYIALYSTK